MIGVKKIGLSKIFRLIFIGSMITLSTGMIILGLQSLPYAKEMQLTEIPSTLLIASPTDEKTDSIEIYGEIGLSGTDLMPCLVLRTEDEEVYAIIGDKKKELWKYRYKKIYINGYLHGEFNGINKSIEVIDYNLDRKDQDD